MVIVLERPPPPKLERVLIPRGTDSTGFAPHYEFAALSTFRDIAAQNLLTTIAGDIKSGFIPADMRYVLCHRNKGENKKTDRYIDVVKGYFEIAELDIPIVQISSRGLLDEEYYEYAFDRLEAMSYPRDIPKWMIGWMKIVPPTIVNRYLLINLHPSGPDGPVGKWEDVVRASIKEGRKYVEGMVHIATPEMDRGPVLCRYEYPISRGCERLYERFQGNPDEYGEKLFERFRKEQQHVRENALIAVAMHMLGTGELVLDGRDVYYNGILLPKEGLLVNDSMNDYIRMKGIAMPY